MYVVMMKKKQSQESGGARLIKSGKRAVLIGLTPEQNKKISAAAEADGRPVTQFLVFHGLQAADIILRKSVK